MLPDELEIDLHHGEEQLAVELDRFGNFKRNVAEIECAMSLEDRFLLDVWPSGEQDPWPRSCKREPNPSPEEAKVFGQSGFQSGSCERVSRPVSKKAVFPVRQGKDWNARLREIEALGYLNPQEAFAPLVRALEDMDWAIRKKAAKALGRLKDWRAIEPLTKALGDKYWQVREEVGKSIIEINPDRAVESLATALESKNWMACKEAAIFLGELGEERAIPLLEKLLNHEQISVRRSVVKALGKIGEAAY
jgi:HEAT repeat protein